MAGRNRYYHKKVLFIGGVVDGERHIIPGDRERWTMCERPENVGYEAYTPGVIPAEMATIKITNYIVDELLIDRKPKEPHAFFFAYPEEENGAFTALCLLFDNYKSKGKDDDNKG